MISSIVAILAGLALLGHWLMGGAAKFARTLAQFDVVIGVIALVIGVLELFSLEGILLILAGLVLSASALRSIPSIGGPLARLGNALDQFRLIIGVLILRTFALLDVIVMQSYGVPWPADFSIRDASRGQWE